MFVRVIFVAMICSTAVFVPATAPVRYFTCPVSKLEIVEGTLPPPRYGNNPAPGDAIQLDLAPEIGKAPLQPRALLNGPGSVELVIESRSGAVSWDHVFVAVQAKFDGPVAGTFKFWIDDGYRTVRWKMPANANTTRAADWFNYGKAARLDRDYRALIRGDVPGQAWFRHHIGEIVELKTKDLAQLWRANREGVVPAGDRKPEPMEPSLIWVSPITTDDLPGIQRFNRSNDFGELLSGGRAVSENLQLGRQLNVGADDERQIIKIGEMKGIDIREFEWQPLVRGLKLQLDPLATLIPADQHVVFFPNVPAAVAVLEEIERTGMTMWNATSPRGVDDRIADRYLKQLALPAASLGKLLPPSLVNGVAITGSDLYFDTGTDLAVWYATPNPALVRPLLTSAWPQIRAANPDAEEKDETIGDTKCRSLKTIDRRICTYVVELPNAILITNSPAQIRRTTEVRSNRTPALASLAEYTFFRDRYRRTDADESGFALLSDAAIRRWCGPKWRIAHHRRLRTGSALAEAQASHLPEMVKETKTRVIDDVRLGAIELGPMGVLSKTYGTRLFQTPIAEVELEKATKAEEEAYVQWRDSYQRNWAKFFDPIAIRLSVKPERLGIDMSVMPLIGQTSYRDLVALSAGAKLPPSAGDPHEESIVHFVVGFNTKSDSFVKKIQEFSTGNLVKTSIESWIGDWFTAYADQDPLWEKFAKSEQSEMEFWSEHNWRIPVGVAVAVNNPDKHAAFVKEIRDRYGMGLNFQEVKHKGVKYMRFALGGSAVIYSVSLPNQWLLTPNEDVAKRAIDRFLTPKDGKPAGPGWLGDSVAMTVSPQVAEFLRLWQSRRALEAMQRTSWANLPILNEWHALDATMDGVAFHEKWWGERLLDPAGGKFVWNANDGTMESTTLGHPGRPKGTAMIPPEIAALRGAEFGITFERDGLRARVEVKRAKRPD